MATIDIGLYEPHSERISIRAPHGGNLLMERSKLQQRINDSDVREYGEEFAVGVKTVDYYDNGCEATVTIYNPIIVSRTEDGFPEFNKVTFTARAAEQILRRHPNIDNITLEQTTWNLESLKNLFKGHQGELRNAIREITGHDGIVVQERAIWECDVYAWYADQITDITARVDPAYAHTRYPATAAEWYQQISEREPTEWDLIDHGKPWHLQPRDTYQTNEQGQAISKFGETTPNLLISEQEANKRAEQFAEKAIRALTEMGYPPRFGMRPLWIIDTINGPIPEIPAKQPIMDKATDLAHIIGAIHIATEQLESTHTTPNADQIDLAMGVGHLVGDKLLEAHGLAQVNEIDPWMVKRIEQAAHELKVNLLDHIATTPDPWAPANAAPGHETGTAIQATDMNRTATTNTTVAFDPWKPTAATGTGQAGLPKPAAMQTPGTGRAGVQGPAVGL